MILCIVLFRVTMCRKRCLQGPATASGHYRIASTTLSPPRIPRSSVVVSRRSLLIFPRSKKKTNPMSPLWRVPATTDPDKCPKQFVDYQNDTSAADIRLVVREGYRNVEHVKRYTALGFGTDQGKLGNINGMAILAECLGEEIPAVGTTTFRPAYTPVTFGTGARERRFIVRSGAHNGDPRGALEAECRWRMLVSGTDLVFPEREKTRTHPSHVSASRYAIQSAYGRINFGQN